MSSYPEPSRCRLLLLGTSDYQSRDLPDIPAVRRNLTSLRAALTAGPSAVFCPSPDVTVVGTNPRSVDAFMRDLSKACAAASDVLFVYYAGHGVLDSRMRLNLALRRTDPNRPEGNSVPLWMVKEQVETARARVRVLVLDCCFSGQALGRQSAAAVVDEAAAAAGKIVDTDVRGMYVLTSTEATEMGRYVVGEPHTAFTDALLAAIRAGGDGTRREVRLGELYASTRQTLQRRQLPLPRCRQDDTSGDLVIRRGRAVGGDVVIEPEAAAEPVTGRGHGRALLAGGASVAAAVVTVVALNVGPNGETPVAPSTAPVVTSPAVGDVVFSDDFSGPTLDTDKWLAPEVPGIVGQRGGQLRFVVRPGAEVDTSLEPVTLTRPFEQMTFDIAIPQYAKAGPGGVALILNPRSDQPQWLAFGPSPEGRTIYPLICAKAKCTNGVYTDFVEPTGTAVAKVRANEMVPVKVVRADGHLRFYVRDMLVGETPADPGPLTDFRFAISAADTESWDIDVDNIVCR